MRMAVLRDREPAVSVVIAFVLILGIIVSALGAWAIFGVPGQMRAAEEMYIAETEDAFVDYRILLSSAADEEVARGVNLSFLLPLGSAASSGALEIEHAGKLEVFVYRNFTDEDSMNLVAGNKVWEQDISRIVVSRGFSQATVGYEAGGVYRRDGAGAFWATPVQFAIHNSTDAERLYVQMYADSVNGTLNVGGNGNVAYNTQLVEKAEYLHMGEETDPKNVTIRYTADTDWNAALWYSQFFETWRQYNASYSWPDNVTVGSPKLSGMTVRMDIYSLMGAGEILLDLSAPDFTANEVKNTVVHGVYRIVAGVEGGGGTIEPSGVVRVREGESQTFTITAKSEYSIDSVSVDGGDWESLTFPTYEFSNVIADHSIMVKFR